MPYVRFLSTVLSEGRVTVPAAVDGDEPAEGGRILVEFERLYRQEMPGTPPSLDLAAAQWAALRFFHACRLTVHRDLGAEVVQREMTVPCPSRLSAAVAYSVDLTFRFLPDLLRFARTAAEKDPLVEHLLRWAREWPLSSVGVTDVGSVEVDAVLEHPAVLALYLDRILERDDAARLADERVKQAARAAVGLYPHLAGKLADCLSPLAPASGERGGRARRGYTTG